MGKGNIDIPPCGRVAGIGRGPTLLKHGLDVARVCGMNAKRPALEGTARTTAGIVVCANRNQIKLIIWSNLKPSTLLPQFTYAKNGRKAGLGQAIG